MNETSLVKALIFCLVLKFYKVSACYGIFQNTIILMLKLIFLLQKMVKLLVVVLSFKVWEQILKMTTMASKRRSMFFCENFKEFNVLFD